MFTRTANKAQGLTNALIWHVAAAVGYDALEARDWNPETDALVGMIVQNGLHDALRYAVVCYATGLHDEPSGNAMIDLFATYVYTYADEDGQQR